MILPRAPFHSTLTFLVTIAFHSIFKFLGNLFKSKAEKNFDRRNTWRISRINFFSNAGVGEINKNLTIEFQPFPRDGHSNPNRSSRTSTVIFSAISWWGINKYRHGFPL